MKIVVTGAAGFIGSHLAERLTLRGHEVVGIDCFTDYYALDLKELNARDVEAAGVPIARLDLAVDPLDKALDGCEVLFHLAAQPGISACTPFEQYLQNNVIATHRLLEAAKRLPSLRTFVNIATSSVYGADATDSEDAAPKPTSHYGVTKLAAEQMALAACREGHLSACSLRLFSVYGERERPEKLYRKLIRCILADAEFPLFEGSLQHSRSFTYVGDIIDGFEGVLNNLDRCRGEIINLGTDIEITTEQGIQIVESIMGKKARLAMQPRRPGDQLRTHANIEKARRLLNYEPKTTPEEGLKAEVKWCCEKVFGQT